MTSSELETPRSFPTRTLPSSAREFVTSLVPRTSLPTALDTVTSSANRNRRSENDYYLLNPLKIVHRTAAATAADAVAAVATAVDDVAAATAADKATVADAGKSDPTPAVRSRLMTSQMRARMTSS